VCGILIWLSILDSSVTVVRTNWKEFREAQQNDGVARETDLFGVISKVLCVQFWPKCKGERMICRVVRWHLWVSEGETLQEERKLFGDLSGCPIRISRRN